MIDNNIINYFNVTGANNINFRILVHVKNEHAERMNSIFRQMKLYEMDLNCQMKTRVLHRYTSVTKKIPINKQKSILLVNLRFRKPTIEDHLADLNLKDPSFTASRLVGELKKQNIDLKEKEVFTFQFKNFSYFMNPAIFAFLSLKSSYFRTLYDSNYREAIERVVDISEEDPEDFKLLIKNILQPTELNSNNIYTLLELSARFDFTGLEKSCHDWLLQFLQKIDSEDLMMLWEDNVLPIANPIFQEAAKFHLKRLAAINKEKFIEFCRKCVEKKLTFEELNLSEGLQIDIQCLNELQPLSIQRIDLSNTHIKGKLLGFQTWNTLTCLNLSGCSYCEDSLDHLRKIPNLRSLILSYAALHYDDLLKLKQLTSLNSLDISGMQSPKYGNRISLDTLLSSMLPTNLQNLNLGGWCLNNNDLKLLKELTALRSLGLKGGNFNKIGIQFLRVFTFLHDLDLSGCTLANGCLESLKELNLRRLDLSWCTLDIEDLAQLKWMTSLEYLDLGKILKIRDEEIQYLKELNLKSLDLSESKITDKGLVYLKKMKNIEYLNLSNCGITDIGVKHLTEFKFLRHLDLSECNITDEGLSLLLEEITSLRFLTVIDCFMVTKKRLFDLMQRFPLLTIYTRKIEGNTDE